MKGMEVMENMSRHNARLIDPALISREQLENLSSIINSISPNRPDYAQKLNWEADHARPHRSGTGRLMEPRWQVKLTVLGP